MASRGYTLAEVIVAVTVLAVGVLGVASAVPAAARLIRWGGAQSASATVAAAQLETLRAGGCARLASGELTAAGRYRLRWTVEPEGPLRRVTLIATYAWGVGVHSDLYETAVACTP
jgi:prepilin-type N-terminal cleavage/methylation domain-containing protein